MESLIFTLIHFECILSIKLGSYNTLQTSVYGSSLRDSQIQQLSDSDIDVLCLQELFLGNTTMKYLSDLQEHGGYVHSFSMMDILSPQDLQIPRTPCLNEPDIAGAFTSDCSDTHCRSLYDDEEDTLGYAQCMARECPSEFTTMQYRECTACMAAFVPFLQSAGDYAASMGFPDITIEDALRFCEDPPDLSLIPIPGFIDLASILYNFTDGMAIAASSEYPIRNTWSFVIPSYLVIQERLYIAEIDICAETQHEDAECTDSIIVGCAHFNAVDVLNDTDIVQSPQLEDDSVTSNVGLNRFQTEYVLEHIFNDDILSTLGREDAAENVFGVFLMGDMNSGEMFDRCGYARSPSDGCGEGDTPSNPFRLFADGGFVDGPRLADSAVLCTFCLNETSHDFNVLAQVSNINGGFISTAEASCDLDHVLVQEGYSANFKTAHFEREFIQKTVEGIQGVIDENVPASDHYAVRLEIEFEPEGGGRAADIDGVGIGERVHAQKAKEKTTF